MRWMAIAAVIAAAACGGSEPRRFAGTWNVQFSGTSGQMTIAADGADGIGGVWDVAGVGNGAVAGSVGFNDSIDLAFADASHQILVSITATVAANSMSGVVNRAPPVSFTATRR